MNKYLSVVNCLTHRVNIPRRLACQQQTKKQYVNRTDNTAMNTHSNGYSRQQMDFLQCTVSDTVTSDQEYII